MIIGCPNCNKKFKIDEKLIPENGRLLQCSNCKHKWYYNIPHGDNFKNENVILSIKNEKPKKKFDELSENVSNEKKKIKKIDKFHKKNFSLKITLNTLIIAIITFVAMILLLDTFKSNIGNYIPGLLPLLESLYETLIDIKFFINDLIK